MYIPQQGIIQHRERVIQRAEELGNVKAACADAGVSRTQYYEWKRRYEAQGRVGLLDRRGPQPRPVEQVVIGHALLHPLWGCGRLSKHLKETLSLSLSGPSIQDLLHRHGLGYREDRVRTVEKLAVEGKIDPPKQLVEDVAKINPRFAEIGRIPTDIGELVVMDTAVVGDLFNIGRLYVTVMVETAGCLAWAFLHPGRTPEMAVLALRRRMYPFYEQRGWLPDCIQTPRRSWFYQAKKKDQPRHFFRVELQMKGIEHQVVPADRKNGLITAVLQDLRKELFRPTFLDGAERSLQELQDLLDNYLDDHNRRPINDWPANGRAPHGFWFDEQGPCGAR